MLGKEGDKVNPAGLLHPAPPFGMMGLTTLDARRRGEQTTTMPTRSSRRGDKNTRAPSTSTENQGQQQNQRRRGNGRPSRMDPTMQEESQHQTNKDTAQTITLEQGKYSDKRYRNTGKMVNRVCYVQMKVIRVVLSSKIL